MSYRDSASEVMNNAIPVEAAFFGAGLSFSKSPWAARGGQVLAAVTISSGLQGMAGKHLLEPGAEVDCG